LLHSRSRGKGQSRILYYFRTPPDVRVGRGALDEEAIRLLEEHNPQIEFDWTRILKQGVTEGEPPPRAERRPPPPFRGKRDDARQRVPERRASTREPEPAEPAALEEMAPERETATEQPQEPFPGDRAPAALERLGAETLARLRARYAEVLARISERPMDEPDREQLKLTAERLNPDAWVTAEDVTVGLEHYEQVYEQLRGVVGTRRRRRRR
jgi:hypothetical protein